jgi:membrane-anchored protein YejM (alkaline phosphatase superfamily)
VKRPFNVLIVIEDGRTGAPVQTLRLRLPLCNPRTARSLLTLLGEWAQQVADSVREGKARAT